MEQHKGEKDSEYFYGQDHDRLKLTSIKAKFGNLVSHHQKLNQDQKQGNMTDRQNPCTERTIHLSDKQKIHVGPLESSRTQVKDNDGIAAGLTSSFVQSSVDSTMDDCNEGTGGVHEKVKSLMRRARKGKGRNPLDKCKLNKHMVLERTNKKFSVKVKP